MLTHDTFVITKHYKAAPSSAFNAFSDPGKKRRWYADREQHHLEAFDMNFQTDGEEILRFRFGGNSPVAGLECVNVSKFLQIVPDQTLVMASTMDIAGRRISASLCTFEFRPAGDGTELVFTHQGTFFEGSDGPAMRRGGWQKLLDDAGAQV